MIKHLLGHGPAPPVTADPVDHGSGPSWAPRRRFAGSGTPWCVSQAHTVAAELTKKPSERPDRSPATARAVPAASATTSTALPPEQDHAGVDLAVAQRVVEEREDQLGGRDRAEDQPGRRGSVSRRVRRAAATPSSHTRYCGDSTRLVTTATSRRRSRHRRASRGTGSRRDAARRRISNRTPKPTAVAASAALPAAPTPVRGTHRRRTWCSEPRATSRTSCPGTARRSPTRAGSAVFWLVRKDTRRGRTVQCHVGSTAAAAAVPASRRPFSLGARTGSRRPHFEDCPRRPDAARDRRGALRARRPVGSDGERGDDQVVAAVGHRSDRGDAERPPPRSGLRPLFGIRASGGAQHSPKTATSAIRHIRKNST